MSGALQITGKKAGRASVRISESTSGKTRVLGVRINNADGSAPGLPNYLAIGSVSEDSTADLSFWSDFANAGRTSASTCATST